jgi:ubiquinone/menaquinone biosynthesis C-methylase UbiE
MERIPEPDLMDDVEQAMAYAGADFSEPHEAFVTDFAKRFPAFSKGEVLDLGCGTADVIIRFANAFPESHITGIDGAQAMLDIGLSDIEQKGLSNQIKLQNCLLPDNELSKKQFDAVISNSLLHHLSDPLIIWQTVKQCAKYGAPILTMDLLRPYAKEKAEELVHLYAADTSPILQRDFYNSLLASYTADEIQQQLETMDLDYLTVEIVSDRHLIVWGCKC